MDERRWKNQLINTGVSTAEISYSNPTIFAYKMHFISSNMLPEFKYNVLQTIVNPIFHCGSNWKRIVDEMFEMQRMTSLLLVHCTHSKNPPSEVPYKSDTL